MQLKFRLRRIYFPFHDVEGCLDTKFVCSDDFHIYVNTFCSKISCKNTLYKICMYYKFELPINI